jgi:hypothetical protein
MKTVRFFFLLCFLVVARGAAPLSLYPENPHYFLFRGKPEVIITSGEHYGAVLNLDFDYNQFTGVYFEPPGAFNISENSMAPANGRYIGPWPRTAAASSTCPNGTIITSRACGISCGRRVCAASSWS